jgi:hypothetical protein
MAVLPLVLIIIAGVLGVAAVLWDARAAGVGVILLAWALLLNA